ncbi:MAG: glycosyltransferase [Bacteroidota bacterium]
MSNGIIIPCYNESSRLDLKSFIDYAAQNKHNVLCFVNDGSSDTTRETLAKIKSLEHENVHIYNLTQNSGKAKAVQQGALYLYNQTSVKTIGFIDADLSTDFQDYADLLWAMKTKKNLKVIYGSRAATGENEIKRDGIRSIISAVIRLIIFCITRLKIKDTQCGAKVFDRALIPTLFSQEFKTRWLFDVEILLRLKKEVTIKRFRQIFLEKPLTRWVHMDGSKLGMKDALSIPASLMKIGWIYNFYHPLWSRVIIPLSVSFSIALKVPALKVLSVGLMFVYLILSDGEGHSIEKLFLASFNVITIALFFSSTFQKLKLKLGNNLRWLWIKARFRQSLRARSLKLS